MLKASSDLFSSEPFSNFYNDVHSVQNTCLDTKQTPSKSKHGVTLSVCLTVASEKIENGASSSKGRELLVRSLREIIALQRSSAVHV